ncbi:MAG: DUF3352 domain-containing protein [Solirubrobacterales bacterium]
MKRPRRPRLPRPRLPRPKLRRPKLRGAAGAGKAAETGTKTGKRAKPRKPTGLRKRLSDVWFRVSTRFRAIGYLIREKAQQAGRLARRAGAFLVGLWANRSRGGKLRIVAVAAVLAIYGVVKFAPIGGIPCEISVANECAPPNETVDLVPADALLYAHFTLDDDSTQFERASDAFDELSDLRTILAAELPGAIPAPSGATIDPEADLLPWAERDLALALLPGGQDTANPVLIAGVADREAADAFVAKIAPAGAEPTEDKQGEATLDVYPGGFAASYLEQGLVLGDEPAVRAVLDADAGTIPSLPDAEEGDVRDELPEARFAEVYLSREGVQRLLSGRGGAAAQLETFVDYGATAGMAAAAVAKEDGIEVELVSDLDPKLTEQSPSFFSALPDFEPGLADEAGSRAIGYVGVGELGPSLNDLLAEAGEGATGLPASLQALAAQLETEVGVDPLRDLLPILGGEAAVVAEPTDGVPFASLIVDDVDEDRAAEALAALQKPLLSSLRGGGRGRVSAFTESDVDGVTVRSIQLSPTVNLAYALFDGKLVISTDPAGVEQVRADSEALAESKPFERVDDHLPDQVSALVFLNLDELFGQVTRTDLVEDPFFANLSVLFDNASALGLAVNGEADRISSDLFLALD